MTLAALKTPQTKRGGPRAGSGRKPSELTVRFRDYFAGDLDVLCLALRDLALGHRREDSEGRVYVVAPDRGALVYILDRLLGRMNETTEPVDVAAIIRELRGEP